MKIIEFINKRWKKDCDWQNGNCYWFAHILVSRFPRLNIYYLPIQGHFVAGDNINFYDSTGKVELEEKPYLLSQIEQEDPNWYNRLVRDCII